MIHIAVMCKDNKSAAQQFYNLRHFLEDNGYYLTRIDYANWIVGTDICRVRFYSTTGSDEWRHHKVDIAFGFKSIEQRDILKEGRRISRKYSDFNEDFHDKIVGYFE